MTPELTPQEAQKELLAELAGMPKVKLELALAHLTGAHADLVRRAVDYAKSRP